MVEMAPSRSRSTDDLGQFFRALIADELGIPADQVTLSFIVEDRERRFYPTAIYNVGSAYGGYRSDYLPVLSLNQFDMIDRKLDKAAEKL